MLINNLDDVAEVLNQLERKILDLQVEGVKTNKRLEDIDAGLSGLMKLTDRFIDEMKDDRERIKAVEILFNNINEINYINKTKRSKK